MTDARLPFNILAKGAFDNMLALNDYLSDCGLDLRLLELVNLRVSQINCCLYCLAKHTHELRLLGENQIRLDILPAWRESEHFSERERAALAWAESLTLLEKERASDALYADLKAHLTNKEIVDITFAITTMNAWNRVSAAFRLDAPVPAELAMADG